MKRLFNKHPFALGGFVLAAAVTLFFIGRIVVSAVYWADPAHHNETVKPWMTVGYIAQSWDLDPREIDRMANLPLPDKQGPMTLREIARERGVAVEEIIKQVNATIAVLQMKKVLQ